jgi:tubulin polyglutamylase TTLL9
MEKKFSKGEKKLRAKVGGFDLVYNDGPVKHEKASYYSSYLGCHQPIPKAPRKQKR